MRNRDISLIVIGLFTGAIIGGVIGNIMVWALPEGVVKDFFLMYQDLGWQRTTLNLGVIKITTGFIFSISVCSLIGLFISWYFLRYFR